jgi:two-component system cell cycle sensor histidine kinase/response regulator CckA
MNKPKTDAETLLLVDDTPDNLVVMKKVLQRALPHVEIVTFQKPAEVMDYVRTANVSAAIFDVQMPVINGIELCKKIKSTEETRHIPVLLATSHEASSGFKTKGLDAGADDFLTRPIDNDELVARVKVALRINRAEAQLRRTVDQVKQDYQLLFEKMLAGFAVHEMIFDGKGNPVDYRFLTVNPAFETLLNLRAEEVLGKTIGEVIPGLEPRWLERYGRVVETGESVHFEDYSAPLDRYFDVSAFRTGENQFATSFTDITERKQAEAALCKSEERFNIAADAATIGVWEFDVPKEQLVWDNRMFQLYDIQPDEFTGAYEAWYNGLHPEDRQRTMDEVTAAASGQKPFDTEFRIIRPDGCIRHIRAFGKVIRAKDGTPLRMIGTNQDITRHKQAELAVQNAQALSSTIIDSIPGTFYLLDEYGRYARWNTFQREVILGKTEEQMAGMNALDTIHPEDRALIQESIANVLQDGKDEIVEGRVLLRGGPACIWMLMTGRRMVIAGRPFLVGTGIDITERKQAAAALQASEKRFRNFAESMSDWVWEVNADGIYTFSSSNIKTTLGYQEAEILGKTPFDFMPADEAKRVGALFGEIVRDKRGFRDLENWNLTKDGRRICLLTSGTPIFGNAGEFLGYRGVDTDITERKQAEEELQKSEEIFRSTISDLLVGVVVHAADSSVLVSNSQASHILGLNKEQMTGKQAVDPAWNFVHEDLSVMKVENYPVSRVISTGKRIANQILGIKRPDREEITWVSLSAGPVFSEKKVLIRIITNFMDITERKQAEAEKERFLTAIDQVEETIVITDADGTIQYVNPAFEMVSGYTCEEAIGQNPRIIQSGEHDDTFYQQMWNTLLRGETWSGRMVNKKKDGTLYTEEAVISPVKDGFGKTVNYVAVKRNVTEELKREEQFRQSQKMEAIGQLAGGVAHDFNNILQAILGYSEILLGRLNEGTQEHRDVAEIKKSASCAAYLTRQLLTFSRKQPLEKKSVNLNAFIEDTQGMIKMMLEGNIIPVLDLAQDLPLVSADAGQLSQIIMNLSVNARDAMPNGGQLTFKTENIQFSPDAASAMPGAVAGDFVCLAVTDTGYGMSQQVKDHLFEPFFTTKGIGKGTGLGLSVLYGIVKQHNGWIAVDSEEGRGTTFKIYLPVCSTKACASEAQPAPESEPKHEHILLVEDDPEIRRMVVQLLQSAEYQISEAESAEEALALFNSQPEKFDLLFSDIVMPGQNGIELADVIRQKKPALPVLLYSGYMNPHERWGNFDSKGYRFLQKPFTITTLLMAVYEALADVNQPE